MSPNPSNPLDPPRPLGAPDPMDATLVSDASATSLIGTVVGSYKVLSYLGAGGMGAVYLAEHMRIGQAVALKVLHADMARDPKLVRRFEDEARAAARAGHRNIVQVFDFGELPDGRSYFVMERLKGQSLARLVSAGYYLPVQQALLIAREIALALGAAHRAGVVHRDLKPDNIFLVDDDGDAMAVKVLDFGIAKLQRDPGRAGLTEAGLVFGTPSYMSPEQARASGDIDGRSDLYALGIVLFEMLTGYVPFKGEPGEVLAKHILTAPPDPRAIVDTIPEVIAKLVLRLLSKNREERFANAEALVAELTRMGVAPSGAGTLPGLKALAEAGLGGRKVGPAQTGMTDKPTAAAAQAGGAGIASLPTMASGPVGARAGGTGETGANMAAEAFVAPAPARAPRGKLLWVAAALGAMGLVLGGVGAWWFALGGVEGNGEDEPAHDRPHSRKLPVEATAAPGTANVTVRSDPPKAEVFLAGETRSSGVTPLTLPVSSDAKLHVTLKLEGFGDAEATLDPSGARDVMVPLVRTTPATAALAASAAPATGAATVAKKAPVKKKRPSADTPDAEKADATLRPTF